MEQVSPDLIRILHVSQWGELPDPFRFSDGTHVQTHADWTRRREEILHTVIEPLYGDLLPAPEQCTVLPQGIGDRTDSYRIIAGPADRPVEFTMFLHKPADTKAPYPVVVDGDRCWDYCCDKAWLRTFLDRGIGVVMFDRTEIAADLPASRQQSPLYRAYAHLSFGALMAWAWGYSRCVDALLSLGIADKKRIAFSGHSRGGKCALLAGALDTRASVVNPNNSGCGGCGSFKLAADGLTEDGKLERNETLEDIIDQFDYWFSPKLRAYYGNARALPFDLHQVKALVAPRILLEGNAASDLWANPVGSYQTAMAATEVYRFLGAETRHYWYFRKGYHFHAVEDAERLARILKPLPTDNAEDCGFFTTPFPAPEKAYPWAAPRIQ